MDDLFCDCLGLKSQDYVAPWKIERATYMTVLVGGRFAKGEI